MVFPGVAYLMVGFYKVKARENLKHFLLFYIAVDNDKILFYSYMLYMDLADVFIFYLFINGSAKIRNIIV
jgi:hypothetical protein